MYESTRDATWTQGIDLAQEADFDLGSLRIRPSTCQVEWNGVSQILQRRVMQVLVALVHGRGGVVSQEELVVRCWRGLSVSDDAIYRCISKLRRLAAGYPEPPFTIEAVPGVGYRLKSSGAVEHKRTVESKPLHSALVRPRAFGAAAGLVILLGMGAAVWMFQANAPRRHSLRVAVQPFETLSDSGEARAMARRIPDEVVDALGDSQIESVLVREQANETPTSGSGSTGLIVTGTVREDGQNTIVDARLEDGASRAALWSAEFKRESRQASDLPLEVAARVADEVNITNFARTAQPPLTDDSALAALLQTNDFIRDARDGAWAPMIESARSVVARHPDFAFGHSILADAYAEAAYSINVPDRAKAMSEAARQEADRALELDPEDAAAYAALSELVPASDYHADEAILLRGIRIAKHPREPLGGLYSYEGTLLSNVGRLREALSFQLIAQATDKWGPPKAAKVALIYANMGNMPAARTWIDKAAQLWPNHSAVRQNRLYIAAFYESPGDARAVLDAMASAGSHDEAQAAIWRKFVEARKAHSPQVSSATMAAVREAADQRHISREIEILMLATLGSAKDAIEAANRALDHQEALEPRFLFTPIARNIRQDPGFVALAARMGLIRYWRETGKRPDFCTDSGVGSECTPHFLAALK